MRIAMWSGPRNLSTAMMYAFGARTDTDICDEPFYAAYLKASGEQHPMQDEILTSMDSDPDRIARFCAGPAPDGSPLFYQKHMSHHMLPEFDRSFIHGCQNIFLIRHPARVIASYQAKRHSPTLRDIGTREQCEIFSELCDASGTAPPVIESTDIRDNPEVVLRALCSHIGIAYQAAMLRWPAGGHHRDGVWSKHWYQAAHKTTGFAGPEGALPEVAPENQAVYEQALADYFTLHQHCIHL